MKDILDQPKQLINVKNQLHPLGTLDMTLLNHEGEENLHVQFGYGSRTILNHTQGQVSISMDYNMINANKESKQ